MRSVAAPACAHGDDSAGLALFPQPSTPEPQRFQSRSLGWCLENCTSSNYQSGVFLHTAEEVASMYGDEEGAPQVQRSDLGYFRLSQPQDDGASSYTPQTVCQSRARQFTEREYSHPFSNSLHNAHASASSQQLSPCSFMPSIDDAPIVRRVRSLSCLSADRSLAPARYSVGHGAGGGGAGQSTGRQTTLLSGAASGGVSIGGTPTAVAVARPTVLLHSSLHSAALSMVNHHGGELPEGHEAAVDLSATGGNDIFVLRTYTTHARAISTSVPRLTRLSLSSNGCSPAVQANWSIGRPTTLRCLDTDSDVNGDRVAIQGEEEEDREPWIGGATQVWRGSEVRALLPCSRDAEEESEEALVDAPTSNPAGHLARARDLLTSSPLIAWQPAPLPTSFPASPLDFSDCVQDNAVVLSGAPVASIEEEIGHERCEVTRSSTIPAVGDLALTMLNRPLVDLEAAPRKSYVRADCVTPPTSDLGHIKMAAVPKTHGRPVSGVSAGIEHTPRALASEASAPYIGASLFPDVRSVCSAGFGLAAEWRNRMCSATPQGRSVWAETPSELRGSQCTASATTAEAVAAQLARISIRTSPTPKRLAFEEEELVERGSGGGSQPLISEVCTATGGAAPQRYFYKASAPQGRKGSPVVKILCEGGGGLNSNGTRWASMLDDSGRGESFSSSCPTGLQLLRSRKRCLADMQAADTQERTANALAAGGANSAHCASYVVPDGAVSVGFMATVEGVGEEDGDADGIEEALKRQRREEQRRKRSQYLLPGAPNTKDYLIPASVQVLGTEATLCSSAPFSHALSAPPSSQLAQDRQSQRYLAHSGDMALWSQMGSIDYVTPVSQNTPTSVWGMPSCFPQDSRSRGVVCSAGSDSHVLTPLPANVTVPPSRKG
ncbi:hypothetical protein GH5_00479 [Leishmania sp. Ghana 2012 LV757]|uniref:hypothetical protein n=1 Tax=Leishmania sp. Ghana 2012 LV757 TaxID=2803181 RepID=UPI001B728CE5|nr:hypothetical protein GH5_00479 [Leishmania sp. Ghana 2012 LV757]